MSFYCISDYFRVDFFRLAPLEKELCFIHTYYKAKKIDIGILDLLTICGNALGNTTRIKSYLQKDAVHSF